MTFRAAASNALAVVLAVAFTGCGGTSSGRVAPQQIGWLAFASCMRSNGVPRYPDPASAGQPPPKKSLAELGVSSSRFQGAESACRHLLPGGGRPPDEAQLQQVSAVSLAFARCVRNHGVPSFPDPDATGRIPDPATVGIDQGSPKFEAANTACAKYRPPYMPSNSAYNAWARSHANGSGS
jgi:hypothetical protein